MSTDMGPAFNGSSFTEMFRANPQAQTFVAMLSALFRAAQPLYDPDNALLRDSNAWGKVLRDERFRAYIQQRLAKVGRSEFVVEPASDREIDVHLAATVTPFLSGIEAFTSTRRHLAKFAFWGRSHAWIEGRREWRQAGVSASFKDGLLLEWWVPTFIRPLDKRQIVYKPETTKGPDGKDIVRVKTLLGTIDAGRHEPMENPECLISCVYDDEVERLGHGRGLLETMYHAYWIKGIVRRLLLSGLEKWAHGILVGHIDASARAGQDQTSEGAAAALLETLQAMRAGGSIVVDKNDEVELVSMGEAGQALALKVLEYIDDGVSQLCNASIRPMGGGKGPYGQAEAEQQSGDDLLDCDRELIDEQITRTVIGLWCDLNVANTAALGLAGARNPVFRSRGLTKEDAEKVGRVYQAAQGLGVQITADEAHRRLGIRRPAPGEKILEAPKPEPSGLFGGGFGDEPGGEGGVGGGRPKGIPRSDMPENGGEEMSAVRSFFAMLRARGLRLVGRRDVA